MAAITAGELASVLKLTLRGDPRTPLEGAATLEEAGPRHLSFIAAPKYFAAADRSQAGCLIAPAWGGADGRPVLESETPRAHFAAALAFLYPAEELQPGIHPSAVIETGAHIDPSAEIGPGAVIRSGAFVNCSI